MPDFAYTLSYVLKKNKISANRLASESGVDRTLLSKVMNKTRQLPFYAFKKIIDSLNVTNEDINMLTTSYIDDNIGLSKYNEYLDIMKKFSYYDENRISKDNYNLSIEFNFDGGIMEINSTSEIVMVARHIISIEVEKESGKIYSNIPTNLMSELMKAFPDKKVDFKYIIDDFNLNRDKLCTLSDIFDLMSLGYKSNYYPSSSSDIHFSLLYPHYLITSEYIMHIDLPIGKAFVSKSQSVIKRYTDVFLEKHEKTVPYVRKFNDILMLKESNISVFDSQIDRVIFFDNIGCIVTSYMTLDMWDQIAKPDVPNRNFLRDTTFEYYQNTYNKIKSKTCNLASRNSLTDFVDKGIIETMPREYANPLSKENRIKILEILYDRMSKEGNHFYLIDDNKIRFGAGFGIEAFEKTNKRNYMQFYYETENCPMHYCGNLNFCIEDSTTVVEFAEFLRCFIASDYCYSEEKSFEIIREEILRCKMLPE